LVENVEYIYEHCLGLVGVLKDWLRLACENASDAGRTLLILGDLEATALSNDSLLQMLQEILEGEGRIEASKQRGDELREKLGLQKPESPSVLPIIKKPEYERRRVGERKPNRDPVGVPS
jgi:hypothetical protein